MTELVARNGIAGYWLWWNLAIGGMLTVFFFARLWRRAGIMTDVEFVELRYSGQAAAALRGFRAIYLGLFMNAIVLGWVNKAMEKIFRVTVPEIDPFLLVVISAGLLAIYASASGLAGTARTDSFQFVFAMAGCIILAAIVVGLPQIGGLVELKRKLAPQVTDFLRLRSIPRDAENSTRDGCAPWTKPEIRSTKSEIRNKPKCSKEQVPKRLAPAPGARVLVLRISVLRICFGFRASDFGFQAEQAL